MPVKSRAQYRFMKALEHGDIKAPGMSKVKAKEFTKDIHGKGSYKELPEKSKKKRFDKLIK